jgi:hypothetical protein
MAKTPQQRIANHVQHVERSIRGLQVAVASRNYDLACYNIRQAFKAHLMHGLIAWRTGIESPVVPLQQAVKNVAQGIEILHALDARDCTQDLPVDSASIVSFLVDAPPPTVTLSELDSDRLLGAVLGNGLRGTWDAAAREKGLQELRKMKRTRLSVETYLTYGRLLRCADDEADSLVKQAVELFEKRARDSFFSGGDQTEGGGPDNAFTDDYRLAAVMKKIGYSQDNEHLWRWS